MFKNSCKPDYMAPREGKKRKRITEKIDSRKLRKKKVDTEHSTKKLGFNHLAKALIWSTTHISTADYQGTTLPACVQTCTSEQQKVNGASCPQAGKPIGNVTESCLFTLVSVNYLFAFTNTLAFQHLSS